MGVIGNRRKVTDLLKNLLVSLSTLHFFRDVRIVGVFDPEEEEEWKSMRWLPHIWDDELQTRYLSFDPLTAESFESATLSGEKDHVDSYAKFREKVNSILAERKDPNFQAKMEKRDESGSTIIIFLFASRKKTECFLPMLSENDPAMGISTIFLYDEQYYLPNFCQYIVNVDDPYDDRTATAFYKYRADEKMWFTMDQPIPQRKFDAFCRQMSAIEVEDAVKGQIPVSLTFLQCMDTNKVRDLNVLERWKRMIAL